MGKKILTYAYLYGIGILQLALAAFYASIVSNSIPGLIRPSNPYDISNIHLTGGFNPIENFAKIIVFIILTVLFFYGFKFILRKKEWFFKLIIIFTVPLLLLQVEHIPLLKSFTAQNNGLDTFHHGEQLSPASDYLKGKQIYKDMYVLHGAGEDVFIPAVAISINDALGWNNAVGIYLTITTLTRMLTAAVFAALIILLFRNILFSSVLLFWFVFSYYSLFNYARDTFIWISIGLLAFLLLKSGITKKQKVLCYAAISTLSSLSLLYSVDRGLILFGTFILVIVVSLFIDHKNRNELTIKASNIKKNLKETVLFLLLPFVAIQIIFAVLLGLSGYVDFLRTAFIDIPRGQGLLFSYPLLDLTKHNVNAWVPIVIFILTFIITLYALFDKGKIVLKSYLLFSLILTCMSLVFIVTGYGRLDPQHLGYSTPIIFINFFFISVYQSKEWLMAKKFQYLYLPVLGLILLFIPFSTIDTDRMLLAGNLNYYQIKDFLKTPFRNDDYWLTNQVKQVRNYIKTNTSDSDSIFSYTQQPIYYYLTDRKNPTRFYITWFADPKPLEKELLETLKSTPPKVIIYKSGNHWDLPDYVPMSERTPDIDRWITENYKTTKKIGDVVLLTK